jgi:two-component system, NtrC family, sensor kinase
VRVFEGGLPDVVADAAQMRQVVVNLAVNAIQAMPDGGRLTASLHREGDAVVLEIADTGVGMDEATRRRIFTPFFTTKEVGEGTGLGLAVAHGIVTAHGGTIDVESAPGQGSRFRVRLPLGRRNG